MIGCRALSLRALLHVDTYNGGETFGNTSWQSRGNGMCAPARVYFEYNMTMRQTQVVLPARLLCLFYHTCLDTYAFSFSRSCICVRLPLSPTHAHTCREQMTRFSHA